MLEAPVYVRVWVCVHNSRHRGSQSPDPCWAGGLEKSGRWLHVDGLKMAYVPVEEAEVLSLESSGM